MLVYLLRKLGVVSLTVVGISVISFGLIRMVPGDPVLLLLGERGGSPELVQELKSNLGLDRPIYVQYWYFVSGAARGDLGTSVVSKTPVWEEFSARFPATLELGLISMIWATLLGIPLGVLAAVKRGTVWDYSVMGGALLGYSMPIFWWGLILILFFSIGLGWTPVSGRMDVIYDIQPITGFMLVDTWLSGEGGAAFWDALRHLILPSIVLGTIPLALTARMTRSSVLEVLGEDYVRTARAKGLHEPRVVWLHVLRNALIPVITVVGLMFGSIIAGAVLTESIFSWPGIGRWFVQSVNARDYPVVQGGILLIALMIVFINLMVDLLYAWINPRIRKS